MADYQFVFIARGCEMARYFSATDIDSAKTALEARFPNDIITYGNITEVTVVPDTDPLYTDAMDQYRYYNDGT